MQQNIVWLKVGVTMPWMIYGVTGYTGQLVLEEALRRGHRPIIAGRNLEKLEAIAEEYNLEYMAFHLDDVKTIVEAIADMDIVYHAAGPFIHTSEPMIRACLATNTHYLDITGEINVFERTFTYDDAARKNGIALISGVGFDVVPSDCLALYVSQQVAGATHLETGIIGFTGASAGTTKSALEMIPVSWWARRDGQLVNSYFGDKTRTLTLPSGKSYFAVSVPWGDLSVAYRTTGIPNISSYMAMNRVLVTLGRIGHPLGKVILKNTAIRSFARDLVERFAKPPDETRRENTKSYIWAKATNKSGQSAEAWLETLEPYQYTAKVAILAVEQVATLHPIGALTPAQAFGVDFTLEVEGTEQI
jgi:short subunit dehydrogenase-like uncharacterized protein